jgi:hypothetical protein
MWKSALVAACLQTLRLPPKCIQEQIAMSTSIQKVQVQKNKLKHALIERCDAILPQIPTLLGFNIECKTEIREENRQALLLRREAAKANFFTSSLFHLSRDEQSAIASMTDWQIETASNIQDPLFRQNFSYRYLEASKITKTSFMVKETDGVDPDILTRIRVENMSMLARRWATCKNGTIENAMDVWHIDRESAEILRSMSYSQVLQSSASHAALFIPSVESIFFSRLADIAPCSVSAFAASHVFAFQIAGHKAVRCSF